MAVLAKSTRAEEAAAVAGGAGLTASGFSNRIPDKVNSAYVRRVKRKEAAWLAGEGRLGGLDEAGRAVDPETLSPKAPKPVIDAQGRPQGRQKAPRQAAMGQHQAVAQSFKAKANHPPLRGFGPRVAVITGTAAAGVPLAWWGARSLAARADRKKITKASRRDTVDRSFSGGLAAGGLYQLPSYTVEPKVRKLKWQKAIDKDPVLAQINHEHALKHGVKYHRAGKLDAPLSDAGWTKIERGRKEWIGYNRTLPKILPGAKVRRAMGYTHAGKTGMAATAGVAGLGAFANVKRPRR